MFVKAVIKAYNSPYNYAVSSKSIALISNLFRKAYVCKGAQNKIQSFLKAEILAIESDFNTSIKLLKEAVEIEDGLNYNEPPDWFFSMRHHLGSVQIDAVKYKDAIKTY